MIASILGEIQAIRKDSLVIQVGGVGFCVYVPNSLLNGSLHVGQTVELYTHMCVRENDISLYGFRTPEEEQIFGTLLGISGIGPRLALSILSALPPESLRTAIAQGDVSLLTRIPGIGPKTAQRLLFNLREKIGDLSEPQLPPSQEDTEVLNALTALGYSISEAQRALAAIPQDVQGLDERILAALRFLGSH
ncbi:MAG: Holliday junction branch migration protein RuvA [Anaerolineae bacterium]|nr:Holliday junction branch migration protein RuvA [Anaerolineae bacterium]